MERTRLANLLREALVRLAEDRLEELRRAFRDLLQRGDGAAAPHEADGEPALPQIHPRPLRRGSPGVGGEPYWQYLCGMESRVRAAIDPSSMSVALPRRGGRGRGAFEADDRGGIAYGRHQAQRAERVNVDTTVQEKHIRSNGSRLYDRMRERLVMAARRKGVALRQSYARVGKRLLARQSRYAHAKQWRRARRCTRNCGPSWAGSSAT